MKITSKKIVALVIIVVTVVAYFIMSAEKPLQVIVKPVESGTVESMVANTRAGTVKACRRAHLAPAYGGQIASMSVREGDRVNAGQILMELWNDDVSAQLDLAKHEAKAAEVHAKEICLRADSAKRESKRLVNLHKKGMAADDQLDRAVTDAKAQKAACEGAMVNADVSRSRIAVAEAAVARTVLLAPFDGRVAEVNGELGEYVTPSPPGIPTLPAVDLMDTSCLYVAAPFDEVDVPNVRTGMKVRISLDAFTDRQFNGTVGRIAPYVLELEKQARTVNVEASFDDTKDYQYLIPGYSADIEVILDSRDNVLSIPTEALVEENHVYLLRDGMLEKRQVKTGLSNWVETEIREGLHEGDIVVVSVGRPGIADGVRAQAQTP